MSSSPFSRLVSPTNPAYNRALCSEIEELKTQKMELRRLNGFYEVQETRLKEEVAATKEEARKSRLHTECLEKHIGNLTDRETKLKSDFREVRAELAALKAQNEIRNVTKADT
ncbi:hypothetical protein FA13DRAFT_1819266 [Coprinellus micaceus]|uniref:Uncharacterized protein n=1 Tax=Coprinellus micaceus TaxID=71717 RepID=A0A4Y7SJC0_COPMI|nr:hypothetical protein FA13DRAFT_1819266 [Coprinellus micaceus]